MKKKNALEVIAVNLDDIKVLNRFANQIDTIEYCIDLQQGGITPSLDDILEVDKFAPKIPIHIMLRRSSNDFATSEDFAYLKEKLAQIKPLSSIKGFVYGFLKKLENEVVINFDYTKVISDLVTPATSVFHRAFNEINAYSKNETIKQLFYHNIKTILMSGTNKNITDNIPELLSYQKLGLCKILLGGGIDFNNIKQLKDAGLENFHIGKCIRNNDSFASEINVNLLQKFIKIVHE